MSIKIIKNNKYFFIAVVDISYNIFILLFIFFFFLFIFLVLFSLERNVEYEYLREKYKNIYLFNKNNKSYF